MEKAHGLLMLRYFSTIDLSPSLKIGTIDVFSRDEDIYQCEMFQTFSSCDINQNEKYNSLEIRLIMKKTECYTIKLLIMILILDY